MIALIAAIGNFNEIGYKGKLPWNIPEDMKFFKEQTLGKNIVMGRKTFESIGRTLPGRNSLVITRDETFDKCERFSSIEAAMEKYEELVVIGGEQLYRSTIEIADELIITHVNKVVRADTFFPEIDTFSWKAYWSNTHEDLIFCKYKRKR